VEGLAGLLPLVAIALLFWLLIIRPASRRQKDQVRMQSSLNLGDEVMLTSGIFGKVSELTDDRLMVDIAPGVTIRVARGAIGSVVPKEEPEAETFEPADGDEGSEER
jgi:preprotein translocase subunit YajC